MIDPTHIHKIRKFTLMEKKCPGDENKLICFHFGTTI